MDISMRVMGPERELMCYLLTSSPIFLLNSKILMSSNSLPEVIGRGLLSNPIGLPRAVGGAVLRAQLFLGAVLCWKLEKAPGLLPLLCCVTDGQSSLLLSAENIRKESSRVKVYRYLFQHASE